MAKTLEEAHAEMVKEFNQFREGLGKVMEAVDRLSEAGPEDDVYALFTRLDKTVDEARTGGLFGSGAKGHREARENWLKLQRG